MNIRSFFILQTGHDHFYKLCVYQEILLIDLNKKNFLLKLRKSESRVWVFGRSMKTCPSRMLPDNKKTLAKVRFWYGKSFRISLIAILTIIIDSFWSSETWPLAILKGV